MNFFEKRDRDLIFRENGETVIVSPWGDNALRVRSAILREPSEESAALLSLDEIREFVTCENGNAQSSCNDSNISNFSNISRTESTISDFSSAALEERSTFYDDIEIEERRATIKNGKIMAKLEVQPWGNALRISFYNDKGKLLLSEIPDGNALTKKARHFTTLAGEQFRLKASFVSDRTEKIYGMGQYQQEIFDLKGCNLELAHRNSQASIPFYVSSLGYGFLWNNAAIGEVHFGLNTTEWIANSTKQLDYWITAGDTPAEIEKSYSLVTGRVPMMPEYGLGFWQCKLRYYNQKQVLDIAREYKRRNIPIDVIVIDYYHWKRCGDWRFDEEFFPDPKAMVDELKAMGIETMVSVWPQVDYRSENFEEMKQQGLLVKINSGIDVQMLFHGNNVFMDATNPRTRKYVWEKCKENYADLGINTFWLDEAEPEFTEYAYENYRYHAGTVSSVGNIYPREYARTFYEGQKAAGQTEIVNLIRCAWAGSQRYGALVWSGDIMSTYEDFRKQICAGIHMGISGIPWWTTDIGGFHGGDVNSDDFKELLIRWFEFGTFCPVMRIHGLRLPGTDIYDKSGEKREWTGADNEVWSYGQQAYEFPEDALCYDISDEYMYGSDILVAPVCYEHAVSREVYLPKSANWTLVSTGEVFAGGQRVTVDAPIETIPMFLRDGRQGYLEKFFRAE